MKRPKVNVKLSWFGLAGFLFLMLALVMGVASSAKAATGSFDRNHYLPQLGDNDYDRVWIMVEDSTATGTTIDVTIQATSSGESATYTLVGGSSTAFTTQSGQASLLHATAVGSTTGYVEDFLGSYNYPSLGTSTGALKLVTGGIDSSAPGDARNGTNGVLKVNSSDTLSLVYSGATLDTASVSIVGADDSTIVITTGSPWGTTLDSDEAITDGSLAANFKITIVDPNVNLNPNLKEVIGLQDGFTSGLTGTGSSRVGVEIIDQDSATGDALSGAVASNILLVETGKNTGSFVATGKIYGSSSTAGRGNLLYGTGTEYAGDDITLTDGSASVTFKIVEATSSGTLALVGNGSSGTWTLQYGSSTWSTTGYELSSLTESRIAAGSVSSSVISIYGSGASSPSSLGYVKLIDGNDYCLVAISGFNNAATAVSDSAIATGGAGSTSVQLDTFYVAGARSGDSVKVSYLDALTSDTGGAGTVTSSTAFGATGETGSVAVDKTSVDINDFFAITVVDGNLNSSTTSRESVAYSTWDGTTTSSRGDRLNVVGYNTSSFVIDLSHQDGSKVGTQSVRISNADSTLVWEISNSFSGTGTYGFGDPLGAAGSSSFKLGTQATSAFPLIALTKGDSSTAESTLTGATTNSFIATADAVSGTAEISPDGTHWIAVPVTETGINSSTFIGTVGFDFVAARVTTSSATTNANTFADFTGTSSITFEGPMTADYLARTIGTGSVVRISDGIYKEFREVAGVSGLTLSVTKMSNTGFYTPWKTWVQVVGNDMDPNRADTVSGTQLFRIGGYMGATYRVRYNDALNSSGDYASGDNLATSASNNITFTTHTGELSVSPSGTAGLTQTVVVTLVDEDLNTSTSGGQSTYVSGDTTLPVSLNEVGLGFPSGTSTGNTSAASSDLAKKNGGAAKVVFASNSSSVTSTDTSAATTSNTTHFKLVETSVNSGTFKGSFKLTSTGSTAQDSSPPQLKVAAGDTVSIYYNDSPSGSNENNLLNLTLVSIVTSAGEGVLSLSKNEAFLNGDSVVVTLEDSDLTGNGTQDVYVTSSSGAGSITVSLAETAISSGQFTGTFQTGAETSSSTTPKTIRSVANGTLTVTYQETSPARDVTAQVSTKNFGAVIDITSDAVGLGGNAIVSLHDPESNTSIGSENIVSAKVTSTTDSTGVTLNLTETGSDTGSFLGTILVSSSSSLQNTRIQAATGDTITAAFTDSPDADGSTSVVTDTATVGEEVIPTPTPAVTPGVTPTATVTPVATGSVAGFVTDEETGLGIEGAVVANLSGLFTGTTDSTGYYQIDGIPEGTYTFTATATGYAPEQVPGVTVIADDTTTLDFALLAAVIPTPGVSPTPIASPTPIPATLVIVVNDTEGNPVEGATVTVDGESGVTDSTGAATFSLAVGEYTVAVSATGYTAETVDVTVTPPVTIQAVTLEEKFCPEPDETEATTASVTPDELDLAKGDSEDVIVLVTDDEGCPASGVKVKRGLTSKNKKKIKVTPSSAETDTSGQATFTIKAKKKKGSANVKFKIKGVTNPKVNVNLTE
ncbi:MAG: hypothetical protein E3K37_04125 [Candidatus Kuenenia sp.]|nr:hypothetical protein [Candidatus Kuenenia hertensis]